MHPTIKFEGAEHPLMDPPDFQVEAAFSLWLEREAYLAVARHRDAVGEAEFARMADSWRRDCGLHLYDWGGDLWVKGFFSEAGMREVAWLCFERAKPQGSALDRQTVERMWKDKEARKEIQRVLISRQFPDPNPKGEGGAPASPSPA